ncbi:sialate O-acetylesterase [Labilibaculum sp.]|uniref:sialate O-acetylesterase n=1 Tax=Labilibaculum sp. TaxID=2060723 RepID=UPI0035633735
MKTLFTTLFTCIILFTNTYAGKLHLASLFQEHMVLQRDMPLSIWGEAKPNASVFIQLASDSTRVTSNAEGMWKATLPAQKAGGPFTFSVRSASESHVFNDVMIGEVWICSGQSNMFMGYQQIPELKALDSLAQNIRSFRVKNTVAFSEQKYLDGSWQLKNPPSAVAFSFAYHLHKAIDVPVGIILTCWGSSSIEGWMPRDLTEKLPHFKSIMKEFDADTEKKAHIDSILSISGTRKRKDDIFLRTQPNILYNAMMKPLAPYACRGIVWYQGEANSRTMESMLQYGTSLPLWIKRLRKEWHNEKLNFIGVTLPAFGNKLHKKAKSDRILENPNAPSWAWIRESQLKALELSNTSMITTIDLGEKNNIHPKDKLPVGQRLALLAEKNTLGISIDAEGPTLKKISIKKNRIIVHFNNAQGLKTKDGEAPKAFFLADESQNWVQAEAKIKGKTVILQCAEISSPLYVRYAFAAMPKVNLVNRVDLPTRPFRSDTFSPPLAIEDQ